jgi:hypothetical protein
MGIFRQLLFTSGSNSIETGLIGRHKCKIVGYHYEGNADFTSVSLTSVFRCLKIQSNRFQVGNYGNKGNNALYFSSYGDKHGSTMESGEFIIEFGGRLEYIYSEESTPTNNSLYDFVLWLDCEPM